MYDKNYPGLPVPEDRNMAPARQQGSRRRKKPSFLRRLLTGMLCAALIGGTAGGAFYGVGAFVAGNTNTTPAAGESSTMSSDNQSAASTVNLSYTSSSNGSGMELNVEDVASKGLKSVVAVTNVSVTEVRNYFNQFGPRGRNGGTQFKEISSSGSGVIFSESNGSLYMITNYHVVEGATTLSVTFANDETYSAALCGYDANVDVAVLKVSVADLSENTLNSIAVVELANSDALNVGQQVVAIGNALGYGQSVTTGIVSALDRYLNDDTATSYIQTDAAINPGNSGGALLNMNGELIGVNTAKVSSTDVEGMCYAIPITDILELVAGLMR